MTQKIRLYGSYQLFLDKKNLSIILERNGGAVCCVQLDCGVERFMQDLKIVCDYVGMTESELLTKLNDHLQITCYAKPEVLYKELRHLGI
ncbi:hypothetical protein PN36_28305 [Candidatus Thiomargarita nelsonii]|uniref:Uncharacterized protein n=1 Tax=Candidatus Thiomargarita nelsonii TaxID=1003181 RepID=A0A0A6PHL0_9GAMM|nr:hypothetical protein PN36_28305 [Candidatus Thiomargarita nelsonii]